MERRKRERWGDGQSEISIYSTELRISKVYLHFVAVLPDRAVKLKQGIFEH